MIISLMSEPDFRFDFDSIYNKYKNMVWAIICSSSVTDAFLREDIMQEVFVKLYMSLGRFQSERAVKRWLAVVTKNTLIDMNRKECNFRRYMNISLDDDDIFESCLDITQNAPLDEVLKKEICTELLSALRSLKPIHYDVIVLHYFLEFSPGEISRMLSVPLDTVYSRLSRARSVLYETIGDSIKEYFTLGGVPDEK